MSHGTPNDNRISKVHEPKEFDTPTPLSPFRTVMMLEMPSGKQFPAASIVRPMTA